MRCLFIYNPNSGKGRVLRYLDYIEKVLHKKYDEVIIHRSKSADDIKKTVFDYSHDVDAIIVSGGDGTFNNAVCGVSLSDKRPPLGFIPTGTGNDNSHNLKIPLNVKGALKVILEQRTIYHDVGKVNDRFFVYSLALGACTGTSYTTRQEAKRILGKLAYARDGINEFFSPNVNKVKIKNDKTVIETTVPLLLILNTVSVGGMPFNRYGHLNDGLFDVVLVNNGPAFGRFNILKYFISGLLGLRSKRHAVCMKSGFFTIEVDDSATWCIDGEKGPSGSIQVQNLHNHIQIFAPKRKAKRQKYK